MSKSTLTRRALVASTAAVPAAAALSLPAVAQAAAEHDPIFAAIERYKVDVDAFNSYDGPDRPQRDALEEAYFKAQDALHETVPTTLAGMKAKISFFMSDRGLTDGLTNSEGDVQLHDFLNTLYKSACLMVGVL